MNDNDTGDRRTLTLLVQLFGREVLDRLARAGFDDEAAIARAGANRLASESGISLAVSQRIVAVVEETRGPAPGPRAATNEGPPDTPREPRRRKPAAKQSATKPPGARPGAVARPADPNDPFVDDVALVTWMGFSSKTPTGRLTFSVADGILDPVRREPPTPQEAPRGEMEEAAASPPPNSPAAETRSGTKTDHRPGGKDGSGPALPRTLPGSFWSFGHSAEPRSNRDDAVARPSGRPSDPQASAGAPPRRDRHDH